MRQRDSEMITLPSVNTTVVLQYLLTVFFVLGGTNYQMIQEQYF